MDIRYKSRIIQAKQQRQRQRRSTGQTGGEFFFAFRLRMEKKIPRSAHAHFLPTIFVVKGCTRFCNLPDDLQYGF